MFYFIHCKIMLLSFSNSIYALWLKFIIGALTIVNQRQAALKYELAVYANTDRRVMFSREVCLTGNGLFINYIREHTGISTDYWDTVRDEMFSSKVLFDQYYSVLNSPTGYKYILNEMLKAYPNHTKLKDLQYKFHPLYAEIKHAEDKLKPLRMIDTSILQS